MINLIFFIIFNFIFINNIFLFKISFISTSSLLAFILFNRQPAKIYLGDSGSLFIGFLFSSICLLFINHIDKYNVIVLFIIMLGIPVFDAMSIVLDRISNSKNKSLIGILSQIFEKDKRHIHYLLIDYNLSIRKINIYLSIASIMATFMILVYFYFFSLNNIFIIFFILFSFYNFLRFYLINKLN